MYRRGLEKRTPTSCPKAGIKIHHSNNDYTQNYKLIYEAPKEKGKGIFFINYENSCHSYINDSFKNRYCIISSIVLKMF